MDDSLLKRLAKPAPRLTAESLLGVLRRGPVTEQVLAERFGVPQLDIVKELYALKDSGAAIHNAGETWAVTHQPAPPATEFIYESRPDNTFKFGVSSDQHYCSKYAREDINEDLYDWFEEQEVDRVLNAGNWIDGDDLKNQHDVAVWGFEPQVDYLVAHYPQRRGIATYAVWGEDHEGWYSRREAINVGRFVERRFRDSGRSDWHDLGFMEAGLTLQNANSGAVAPPLVVMHPGGGSSYAVSYRPQKIVECVPMDAEALTPAGWKPRSDLTVGDTILGYNADRDACEWTQITALNEGKGELWEYANQQFKVRCTANHRWAMTYEARAGANPASTTPAVYRRLDTGMGTLEDARGDWRRARVVQAAVGPDGPGFRCDDVRQFIDREAAIPAVLQMTSAQRQAFITGMMYGEGTLCIGPHNKGSAVFSQRPGPVNDAFRLAAFLEGIATGNTQRTTKKINGEDKVCGRTTLLRSRFRMAASFQAKPVGVAYVWCPTTPLGTWVMRQGETITITGNSLQGGEKPSVLLIGHYHKLSFNLFRSIWCIQCGCTQDQTPFMRKKGLDAQVGGLIVTLRQDPETGAITGCDISMRQYFNKGYSNNRWSRSGPVARPAKERLG